MKGGFRSGLAGAMLALLLAVALAAAGWAHRSPGPDDRRAAADLAAYLASGGSVTDICGTLTGSAKAQDDCPVCRMPGVAPLPVRIAPPTSLCVAVVPAAGAGDIAPAATRYPAWHGRAPPVV